jgi:hypothetical protein
MVKQDEVKGQSQKVQAPLGLHATLRQAPVLEDPAKKKSPSPLLSLPHAILRQDPVAQGPARRESPIVQALLGMHATLWQDPVLEDPAKKKSPKVQVLFGLLHVTLHKREQRRR